MYECVHTYVYSVLSETPLEWRDAMLVFSLKSWFVVHSRAMRYLLLSLIFLMIHLEYMFIYHLKRLKLTEQFRKPTELKSCTAWTKRREEDRWLRGFLMEFFKPFLFTLPQLMDEVPLDTCKVLLWTIITSHWGKLLGYECFRGQAGLETRFSLLDFCYVEHWCD